MSNSNDTNNFGSPGNMDDEFNISPRANNYKQNGNFFNDTTIKI